jgi:hypothetical protein
MRRKADRGPRPRAARYQRHPSPLSPLGHHSWVSSTRRANAVPRARRQSDSVGRPPSRQGPARKSGPAIVGPECRKEQRQRSPVFGSVESPLLLERIGPIAWRTNGEPVVGGGRWQPLGHIACKDMSSGEAAATEAASRDFRVERSPQQTITMIDAAGRWQPWLGVTVIYHPIRQANARGILSNSGSTAMVESRDGRVPAAGLAGSCAAARQRGLRGERGGVPCQVQLFNPVQCLRSCCRLFVCSYPRRSHRGFRRWI